MADRPSFGPALPLIDRPWATWTLARTTTMKHGIEHAGSDRPKQGSMDVAPQPWDHIQAALVDLEFWGLLTLGAILLISSAI